MRNVPGVLAAVGDLVEDVVVLLHEEIHVASDTAATVTRRQGGSAANVVAAACGAGGRARFVGQVGDDPAGDSLCRQLAALGAELAVRRQGRTGTVIALVDRHGERTMLSDRGSATELDDPDPAWVDGVSILHVPFYSLAVEPLATSASALARWARERGAIVSIDASSAAVLQQFGVGAALDRMRSLHPTAVLANELEAEVLGDGLQPARLGGAAVVVKRSAGPVTLQRVGAVDIEVPALAVPDVRDTTGAGDAFAAGLLLALDAGADLVAAVHRGHSVAADHLRRGSDRSTEH